MSIETLIGFTLAATLILIVPGPTIILVLSHAINHGKRASFPLVAGVVLGDLTAMVMSLLGLGAVMAASATLFTAFKWGGALYLIYMGISMWRSKADGMESLAAPKQQSLGSLFRNAYVVTALNPKGIIFFVAFLPQFIDPTGNSVLQLSVLGSIFLSLAALNVALYTIFAGQIRGFISTPRAKRIFNRSGGTALVGAGVVTASIQA